MEMSPGDTDLWLKTTAGKQRKSDLKVWLSIGGWPFNDPPTSHVFSDLVGSAKNTRAFIGDALAVIEVYRFDQCFLVHVIRIELHDAIPHLPGRRAHHIGCSGVTRVPRACTRNASSCKRGSASVTFVTAGPLQNSSVQSTCQ
jgi:hypothetical protein